MNIFAIENAGRTTHIGRLCSERCESRRRLGEDEPAEVALPHRARSKGRRDHWKQRNHISSCDWNYGSDPLQSFAIKHSFWFIWRFLNYPKHLGILLHYANLASITLENIFSLNVAFLFSRMIPTTLAALGNLPISSFTAFSMSWLWLRSKDSQWFRQDSLKTN